MSKVTKQGPTADAMAYGESGRNARRGFSTVSFLTIIFVVLAVALAVKGWKGKKAKLEQLEQLAEEAKSVDFGFTGGERLFAPAPKLSGASGLGKPTKPAGSSEPKDTERRMASPTGGAEEDEMRRVPPVSEETRESLLRLLPGGIEKKMRGLIDTSDKRVREIEEKAEQQ